MASPLKLRGELAEDIGLLNGEIRRLASLSQDLKKRRTKLIDDAVKDKGDFVTDYQNLTRRKSTPSDFNERTSKRLLGVERELREFVIEDAIFDRELEKAKAILEQFKRQFPFADAIVLFPIADAEAKLTLAELYLGARLKACTTFIQETLDPFIQSPNHLYLAAPNLGPVFDNACGLARDIDDATLKIMGQILNFYGTLLKKYPLVIKVLESGRQPVRSQIRMLE